jgi:hypothetical protein
MEGRQGGFLARRCRVSKSSGSAAAHIKWILKVINKKVALEARIGRHLASILYVDTVPAVKVACNPESKSKTYQTVKKLKEYVCHNQTSIG